jgi:predicted RNase H-like nuclease (RuvC/YqgF family)
LTKCGIPSRTEFFLQNEVEKFARDIDQMSTLVRTRLYGLSEIDDGATPLSEIQKDWQSKADAVDQLIAAWDHICRIDKEVSALGKQRETLKKQTEVIQSEEYGNLQKEIGELAGKISAFESYALEHKRVSNEISTLAKSLGRLNWSAYSTSAPVAELAAELERKKAEIQAAFDADKLQHDAARYPTQLANKRAELKEFLKKRGLSPENIGELARASEQIADLESKI